MPEDSVTIVVEIEGGCLRNVHCSRPATVEIVDHDNGNCGDEDSLREYLADVERAERTIEKIATYQVY